MTIRVESVRGHGSHEEIISPREKVLPRDSASDGQETLTRKQTVLREQISADSYSPRRGAVREGTLVLIGGACTPHGDALGAFVKLAAQSGDGYVVALTSASKDVRGSARNWRKDLKAAGIAECELPVVETREQAHDSRLVEKIHDASGVFLGGGDQVKLITTLSGTPVGNAIWEHYVNGGTVCGTSAGAAALTELTLAGNEIDEEGNLVEQYVGPGLGLLDFKTLVDTHFSQRRRLYRLFFAVAEYPEMMGLGIDEDTAMIVKGELATIVGKGGVTFVDGRTVRFDNAEEVTKGRQLTLSALRVGIVGTGYTFNLKQRELQALLD